MVTFAGVPVSEALLLRPRPGDVLVLRLGGRLTEDETHRVREQWAQAVEDMGVKGLKGIVLAEGMALEVIRPEEQ